MVNVVYDYQAFVGQRRGGISRYFAETFVHLKAVREVTASLGFIFSPNEHLRELLGGAIVYYTRGGRFFLHVNRLIAMQRIARSQIVHTTYYLPEGLK